MFSIYKLTNKTNGKAYIGLTGRAFPFRLEEHFSRARQGQRNSRIYAAMRKYGREAFSHEVVATSDSEDGARELEKHFIGVFDTYRKGYNSNLGGHGFLKFPDHIKKKISEAQKGKIISAECRAKMSAAKLGDSACAGNFGDHTKQGEDNPRSISYRVLFPDGEERVVTGMRKFCRDNGLQCGHIFARGKSKGFVLLGRLDG